MSATRIAGDLATLLGDLATRHAVPGASVAVLDGEEVEEAATGVLNLATGVEVTPDTLFQIGSITKVYTATALLQAVEDGLLGLDDPVARVLPEFRVGGVLDDEITLRRLLTHTSGIEGDVFDDHGRGDDCIERYVAALSGRPPVHPPGAMFSYCNAGFVVAGRMLEVLRGATWDAVMRERLFGPLGLERTVTLPEEALMHRAAVGHLPDPETRRPVRAPLWMLPRAVGPAGAIVSTAREVLAFARMHLDGGRAPDGTSVLSEGTVAAMQRREVDVSFMGPTAGAWGLGWILASWDGQEIVGHSGGTYGQTAFLRVVPARRFGVCLLTNARTGALLAQDLFRDLFEARAGIRTPARLEPAPALAVDTARYVGRYERANVVTEVRAEDGALIVNVTPTGSLLITSPPIRDARLEPVDETTFLLAVPPPLEPIPVVFLGWDDRGRAGYCHAGGRVSRRVA